MYYYSHSNSKRQRVKCSFLVFQPHLYSQVSQLSIKWDQTAKQEFTLTKVSLNTRNGAFERN